MIIEGDAAAQEFFEGIEEVDDDEVEVEIDDPDGCAEEVSLHRLTPPHALPNAFLPDVLDLRYRMKQDSHRSQRRTWMLCAVGNGRHDGLPRSRS